MIFATFWSNKLWLSWFSQFTISIRHTYNVIFYIFSSTLLLLYGYSCHSESVIWTKVIAVSSSALEKLTPKYCFKERYFNVHIKRYSWGFFRKRAASNSGIPSLWIFCNEPYQLSWAFGRNWLSYHYVMRCPNLYFSRITNTKDGCFL